MSKRAGSKTVEVKGSHAVYVSQPEAVADLIAQAAQGGQQKLNLSLRGQFQRSGAWGRPFLLSTSTCGELMCTALAEICLTDYPQRERTCWG